MLGLVSFSCKESVVCGYAARCEEGLCPSGKFSGRRPEPGRSPRIIKWVLACGAEPPPQIRRHSRDTGSLTIARATDE